MRLELALPPRYRPDDTLAFHRRDAAGVAERVDGTRVRKGVMLAGVPVLLDLSIDASINAAIDGAAVCEIQADGPIGADLERAARAALQGMLGLRIDPAPFLAAVADDALLGHLTRRQGPLRVVQSASVFEALTWAIIGQQINLPFAISLRRTFIEQAGRAHSAGLLCYPEAVDVALLDIEQLTSRKFSRAKAETLLRLARLVADGALALDIDGDIERAGAALLAIKGIGPWTVNYTLLRGWGHPDCSLHGDVAVRAGLQALLGLEAKPDMARAEAWLQAYRPHRTMVAAHLWSSLAKGAA